MIKEQWQIKKITSIALMSVALLLFIIGIVFVVGYGKHHCGTRGGIIGASTSVEFYEDFYTTSAQYTGLAANAIINLYKITRLGFGIIFMSAGVLIFCSGVNTFILNTEENESSNDISEIEKNSAISEIARDIDNTVPSDSWRCSECGKINKNYCGMCCCGNEKNNQTVKQ